MHGKCSSDQLNDCKCTCDKRKNCDHENILNLDFWPIFLKMAAKLLLALNVCTPCSTKTFNTLDKNSA